MKGTKGLETVFRRSFPVLAAGSYLLAFAVAFDSFELTLQAALYNLLLALPLFGLCLMLLRRPQLAAPVSGLLAFLLFYADHYVFSARLTHIRLSDLALLSQALRVANRYPLTWSMELTRRLGILLALFAFLILIYRYYRLKYSKKAMFFLGLGIFAASALVVFSGLIPKSPPEGFNFTARAEERGLLYSWYCQASSASLAAPEGYSSEAAEELLAAWAPAEGTADVRVIVVMNESLADYSLIGSPRFRDPLPFLHSLVERGEAFEGRLAVSVFGGGTANTEYEFLTGHSMAFLPEGSTPYLQYVDGKEESLASELKSLGCAATAIHPYYSEEWNRSQVYRFFGFDRFVSGVDFGDSLKANGKSVTATVPENLITFGDGPLYVRGLISDRSCYERILEEDADFTFAVTMQNHGGYEYDGADFTSREYVTGEVRKDWEGTLALQGLLYSIQSSSTEEEVRKVNQYLTCADLSDQAFEYLLEELGKSERKTVVLLFGDHQPGLLISEHYVDTEEGVDPDYTVPYFLWANFDMEFDAPAYTSPNYLSAILKKNAGLPLTPWDQFRLDMMEKYPVVTANSILDSNGNPASRHDLISYEYVQYMRTFK